MKNSKPITRVMEIHRPRFTYQEKMDLCAKKPIEIFGVIIEHRVEKWFRLDARNIQTMNHVIAILRGEYVG